MINKKKNKTLKKKPKKTLKKLQLRRVSLKNKIKKKTLKGSGKLSFKFEKLTRNITFYYVNHNIYTNQDPTKKMKLKIKSIVPLGKNLKKFDTTFANHANIRPNNRDIYRIDFDNDNPSWIFWTEPNKNNKILNNSKNNKNLNKKTTNFSLNNDNFIIDILRYLEETFESIMNIFIFVKCEKEKFYGYNVKKNRITSLRINDFDCDKVKTNDELTAKVNTNYNATAKVNTNYNPTAKVKDALRNTRNDPNEMGEGDGEYKKNNDDDNNNVKDNSDKTSVKQNIENIFIIILDYIFFYDYDAPRNNYLSVDYPIDSFSTIYIQNIMNNIKNIVNKKIPLKDYLFKINDFPKKMPKQDNNNNFLYEFNVYDKFNVLYKDNFISPEKRESTRYKNKSKYSMTTFVKKYIISRAQNTEYQQFLRWSFYSNNAKNCKTFIEMLIAKFKIIFANNKFNKSYDDIIDLLNNCEPKQIINKTYYDKFRNIFDFKGDTIVKLYYFYKYFFIQSCVSFWMIDELYYEENKSHEYFAEYIIKFFFFNYYNKKKFQDDDNIDNLIMNIINLVKDILSLENIKYRLVIIKEYKSKLLDGVKEKKTKLLYLRLPNDTDAKNYEQKLECLYKIIFTFTFIMNIFSEFIELIYDYYSVTDNESLTLSTLMEEDKYPFIEKLIHSSYENKKLNQHDETIENTIEEKVNYILKIDLKNGIS